MKKAIKTILIIQLCLFAIYLIGMGISKGFNLLEGESFPDKVYSLSQLLFSPLMNIPLFGDLLNEHPIITWFIVIPIYNIIAFFILWDVLFNENSDSRTATKIVVGILFGLPLIYFLVLKTTVALYYISSIIVNIIMPFMELPLVFRVTIIFIVFVFIGLIGLPIVIII